MHFNLTSLSLDTSVLAASLTSGLSLSCSFSAGGLYLNQSSVAAFTSSFTLNALVDSVAITFPAQFSLLHNVTLSVAAQAASGLTSGSVMVSGLVMNVAYTS